jgi:murein DD-endopeptidase MepM/ murein hydrolase activator NlpD
VQYYNYSHGYQNNYAALANPDLTRLGALAGGLGVAAYHDNKAREFIAWARDAGHSEEAIINGLNTLGYSEFAEQLQNELAKQTDQAYRVGMSAAGIMRRKEEEADIAPVSDRDMVSILNGEAGEPIQRSDWGDDTYRLPDGRIVTVSERDTLLFLQKQSLTEGELMSAKAPAAKKTIDHEARWIRSGDRMVYNGKEIQHYHAGDSIIPADVMDKLPPAFQEQVRMMDRAYHEGGAWLDDGYYTWNEGGKYFEQIDESGNHVTIRYENGIRIKHEYSMGPKGLSQDNRTASFMNEHGSWQNIPYKIVKVNGKNMTLENSIIDSQGQALLQSGALNLSNYAYSGINMPRITDATGLVIPNGSNFQERQIRGMPKHFHYGVDAAGSTFINPADGEVVSRALGLSRTVKEGNRERVYGIWRNVRDEILTWVSGKGGTPLAKVDPVLWGKLKLSGQQLSTTGNMAVIRSTVGDQDYYQQFMHLEGAPPPIGTRIADGGTVGTIGGTGLSTGKHAHYGVYTKVQPDVLHKILIQPKGKSEFFLHPVYFLNYIVAPRKMEVPR